ncbi:helix-turn-helix domain-containing protein [Tenacibaculum sp. M341]|uniref:helix-turn-helix domain-containing protein n=1 Tax=Tenacibaculum sp. M341 TaxID=2530339 RepID=UPI00104AF3E4|nr:helix-turn-helix domain-containing protein [Tenacibaculum sp. M341]TCI84470.1 helix-turn-helix domain-containing protein [Tenacibaculum sp. M341]
MKNYLKYFLLLVFINHSLWSQKNKKELHKLFYKVSKLGTEKQFDSAHYYLEKIHLNIREIDNKEISSYWNIFKAKVLFWEANTDTAKEILHKIIKNKKSISDSILVDSRLLLGEILFYEKDYKKLSANHIQIEKLLAKKDQYNSKDSMRYARTYYSMSKVYEELKDKENYRDYLLKTIKFISNAKTRSSLYFELANIYKNDERQLPYLQKSIALAVKERWQLMLPTYYSQLSDFYIQQKDSDKAIMYAKKGLENNDYCRLNWLYSNLGEAYQIKQDWNNAITFYNKALKYTTLEETIAVYNNLRELYIEKGEYKKAMMKNDVYLKLKDSLDNLKVKQEIADITQKYEADKKELTIEILNNENKNNELIIKRQQTNLLFFIALLLFAVLILATVFYFYKKEEKQKHVLFLKNRELAKELTNNEKEKTETTVIEELKKKEIYNAILKLIASEFYLEKEITLVKMAKKMNTNTSYLSKIINESYQQSFSSFINELRVSYVLKSIENSYEYRNLTIDHIADLAGFASSNTFYRAFKKVTGLTPSYYIKKMDVEV